MIGLKPFGLFLEEPPDQAYYWTEEWQRGERQAEAEIAAGEVEPWHWSCECEQCKPDTRDEE